MCARLGDPILCWMLDLTLERFDATTIPVLELFAVYSQIYLPGVLKMVEMVSNEPRNGPVHMQ